MKNSTTRRRTEPRRVAASLAAKALVNLVTGQIQPATVLVVSLRVFDWP
jgi:hypothetical protein